MQTFAFIAIRTQLATFVVDPLSHHIHVRRRRRFHRHHFFSLQVSTIHEIVHVSKTILCERQTVYMFFLVSPKFISFSMRNLLTLIKELKNKLHLTQFFSICESETIFIIKYTVYSTHLWNFQRLCKIQ